MTGDRNSWYKVKKYIPAPLKNKFVVATAAFVLWMVFFDTNSIISQYRLRVTLQNLENKKTYFKNSILETERMHRACFHDDETLEKFARERYMMKKPNEDLFVVIEKSK